MNDTPLPEGVVADNVGLAVLTTLKNYGIDTIFGIPGTHNLEFYRHLEPLGIRAVTSRHEQGAGYAADGWSHQTGKPGVVITTSGPGLLNVLSSAATAFCESRPMIVLAPGVPLGAEFADIGALHETKDTLGAAASVVEWARRVNNAAEAVAAVHDAYELFATGRPRPVYIEVPLDVLEGPAEITERDLEARTFPAPASADASTIEEAAAVLRGAKSPVILAGGGSIPAGEHLVALAEKLDAPLITTMNGKGAIPESHPLALGSALRFRAAHDIVNNADVVLAIGTKIAEVEMWWGQLEPKGTLVRVDVLESQINKNLEADLGLVGSSAAVVPDLIRALGDGPVVDRDGRERVRAGLEAFDREGTEFAPDLTAAAKAVASGLPDDAIVSGDSSQICYFGTSTNIAVESAKSFLYMATYATLGYEVPAAIGAKFARPDRAVVSVLGDGALMFSVQEFVTAVEQGVDIVVVVVDNGGYREIEQNEADRGIPPIGVRLVQPNWPALADAFGGSGHALERAEDLGALVQKAIADGGVQLIHVPLELFQH